MEFKKVKRNFRMVGLKGSGPFIDFGTDVPKLAQKILNRLDELEIRSITEIALFEPKKDENHLEGSYVVGVIVQEPLTDVPIGMVYTETEQHYVTTRGSMKDLGNLHNYLLKWSEDQGHKRNLESYIIETYHPIDNGEEEVEIYLPIHT
ncbi:GyrI-like domain-containing protein [Neobacillus niacini]|uniref:GyrI-like domain-containing protein n=1 Tax=Neobacillus niacini TaxID=86668 RepID=UPI003B0167AE